MERWQLPCSCSGFFRVVEMPCRSCLSFSSMCISQGCGDLNVMKIKNSTETARARVKNLLSRVWGLVGGTEMAVLIINEFIMQFALNMSGTIFFWGNFQDAGLNKLSAAFTKLYRVALNYCVHNSANS